MALYITLLALYKLLLLAPPPAARMRIGYRPAVPVPWWWCYEPATAYSAYSYCSTEFVYCSTYSDIV